MKKVKGLGFETDLERIHHYYKVKKIGAINKNEREWVFAGRGKAQSVNQAVTGDGRLLVARKSRPDFEGNIGRYSVVFDAKETHRTNLELAKFIKPHQLNRMLEHEAAGGVAGFMVRFALSDRVFFVTASAVQEAVMAAHFKKGRKSLSIAFCEENGKEIPLKNNLLDWASVLFD